MKMLDEREQRIRESEARIAALTHRIERLEAHIAQLMVRVSRPGGAP